MAVQLSKVFPLARLHGLVMEFMVLLTIGVLPAVICEDLLCSNEEAINGGRIEWPKNRVEGSVMSYICPAGFYSFPVSWRYCTKSGSWSQLRNVYRKQASVATCEEMTCLAPENFEFGLFDPTKNVYKVGDSVRFQCFDGYQLIGSAIRTCLPNGQWTGNLPRCNSDTDMFCPNPGIPFGARKEGKNFDIFSTVRYHCGSKHFLRGSAQRTCLESGRWSGVEPRCESRHSFDNVEDLTKELDILESKIHNKDHRSGTLVNTGQKTKVDIFFIIDASRSVGNENFMKSLNFVTTFINRVSDVKGPVRFEVITFGSFPVTITSIQENLTPKAVMERIRQVEYREYRNNTGRRTGLALESVHSSINQTVNLHTASRQSIPQQVIIILTAGQNNGIPTPHFITSKISDLVSHFPAHLEIFAIGIGEILKSHLEMLVPKKLSETEGHQYTFYLPTYLYLEKAQEKIEKSGELSNAITSPALDTSQQSTTKAFFIPTEKTLQLTTVPSTTEKTLVRSTEATGSPTEKSPVFECGIRGNVKQGPVARIFGGFESKKNEWPWQVIIHFSNKEFCGGSIISRRWILSAAHCFNETFGDIINLTISTSATKRKERLQSFGVEQMIIHENFRIPSEMNNDIALLKTNESIVFSSQVRPVCLPCTRKSAELLSSARGSWDETCRYEDGLLTGHGGRTQKKISGYVTGWGYYRAKGKLPSHNLKHAQVYIQDYMTCASPHPLTENMFCAKGNNSDTCRGDSGGPFVVESKQRWIQVGITSFGRTPICGVNFMGFYSRVPKLMRWIKERVTDLE